MGLTQVPSNRKFFLRQDPLDNTVRTHRNKKLNRFYRILFSKVNEKFTHVLLASCGSSLGSTCV